LKVTVRVYGNLIPVLGRELTLDFDGEASVKSLSHALSERISDMRQGHIGSYRVDEGELVILVNGRNIDTLEGLETRLRECDTVTLLPPFAGG